MEISNRLKAIANCLPVATNVVVDIGTDHGYIPIYLVKNKIANKCIACDINPKPLQNAKNNISHYKMEAQIETRLGNGLSQIKKGEADAIIIAGMGGMLIIDILKENIEVVKAAGLLILQAQLDIMEVRKYIHSIEFTIVDEKMIYDEGKYYTIITAKPGQENSYSEIGYMFGEKIIEKNDVVFKEFINNKLSNLEVLERNISKAKTENSVKRLEEIRNEMQLYKEVLKCL